MLRTHYRYVVHNPAVPMAHNRAIRFPHTMSSAVWFPTESGALFALRRAYACDRGSKNWQSRNPSRASVATIARYFAARGYSVKLETTEFTV